MFIKLIQWPLLLTWIFHYCTLSLALKTDGRINETHVGFIAVNSWTVKPSYRPENLQHRHIINLWDLIKNSPEDLCSLLCLPPLFFFFFYFVPVCFWIHPLIKGRRYTQLKLLEITLQYFQWEIICAKCDYYAEKPWRSPGCREFNAIF